MRFFSPFFPLSFPPLLLLRKKRNKLPLLPDSEDKQGRKMTTPQYGTFPGSAGEAPFFSPLFPLPLFPPFLLLSNRRCFFLRDFAQSVKQKIVADGTGAWFPSFSPSPFLSFFFPALQIRHGGTAGHIAIVVVLIENTRMGVVPKSVVEEVFFLSFLLPSPLWRLPSDRWKRA